jgi:hypothetical protein
MTDALGLDLLNFGALGAFVAYLILKDRRHDKMTDKIIEVVQNNTIALSRFNTEAAEEDRKIAEIAIAEITDLRELRKIQEKRKLEVSA